MKDSLKSGDILLERYEISCQIKKSNVYKAYDTIDEINVAIIKIPSYISSNNDLIKLINDVFKSIIQLDHPNILSVYQIGYDYQFGEYFIAMEIMDYENLHEYLNKQDNQVLSEDKSSEIIEDILKGITYAHHKSIPHLSLSHHNIFISQEGDIKIDFTNFVSLSSNRIFSTEEIEKLYLKRLALYNSSDDGEELTEGFVKDIYILGLLFYGLSSEPDIFKNLETEVNHISEEYIFNINILSDNHKKALRLLSLNWYKRFYKTDDFFSAFQKILMLKENKKLKVKIILFCLVAFVLCFALIFSFVMDNSMTNNSSVTNTIEKHSQGLNKKTITNNNQKITTERINKYKYSTSKVRTPLPHSGFFMRRNNEYGTKLELGIKKLIDQGIMIGHEQIRFDDFVAPNSDLIPFPNYGEALNICYGIAEIPLRQKPDPNATHYLEIALKTSKNKPPEYVNQNDVTPVAYVFVIDVSGSMDGQKLDTVKTSIRELINSLKQDDIVGLISFNDSVSTVLKSTLKKNLIVHDLSKLIGNIEASGGTDINLGLSFGLDEMSRYENYYAIKQLYLFSDGNPTSGETNWLNIRKNISSQIRKGIHVSTFAFGSDANSGEMDALAGMTGGKHMFVTNTDSVTDMLQNDLKNREYISAINIQMKIDINQDIDILHLYGHELITEPLQRRAIQTEVEKTKMKALKQFGVQSQPDIINDEMGIRIFVPDLAQNETYWVVFELALKNDKISSLGTATINYIDAFKKENKSKKIIFQPDSEISTEIVVQHGLGLWTSEVIFDALEDLYQEDLSTAKTRIENHLELMKPTNIMLESNQIADDRVTLKKFLSIANNLGKYISSSDAKDHNSYFMFNLNQFGQSKAGWIRRATYANPEQ